MYTKYTKVYGKTWTNCLAAGMQNINVSTRTRTCGLLTRYKPIALSQLKQIEWMPSLC